MHENVLANLESNLRALSNAATERRDCRDHLARLDEIARLAGPQLPPELRHYLEKRSYEKALIALQGHDCTSYPARSA